MSKLIISILLMLQTYIACACERDIHIAYPPFINLLTINQFFNSMHHQLSLQTGCNVQYVLNKSFDDVLEGILNYKYEAILLPGAYIPIATEMGYQHVATTKREDVIYIVSRKEFKGGEQQFSDLDILILDHYSESGAIFKEDMNSKGILSQVNIRTGGSYDQMILSVVKRQADLAVVIPEYWNLLSPEVRDKHLKIVYQLKSLPAGMVTLPNSESFSEKLYQVLLQEKGIRWKPPMIAEAKRLPLLEAFIKRKVAKSLEH